MTMVDRTDAGKKGSIKIIKKAYTNFSKNDYRLSFKPAVTGTVNNVAADAHAIHD